ncbi:TIGR04283 family arsenosugar biosynthesis glycosyltransferase [Desulfatirhabdium butyrativorans]|uniref:TIGR04283 family arsenosugar biosynthesis glycosyltransferase n=1 Tax=Desulfatirhabdium butyrativorans TaxID=340467 RepID=UPI000416A88A|nr:TIGR04283 family arsenosugar biosynthesis glycosyltransferase [Desulfatirhabdium butyrativorans]
MPTDRTTAVCIPAETSFGMVQPSTGNRRLILFSRFPAPGSTKTRMIPLLGAAGAASLQKSLTGRTVATARCVASEIQATIDVFHEDGNDRVFRRWLGKGLAFHPQKGTDLGERMAHAFRMAFNTGADRVILAGCDCPQLGIESIRQAFSALDTHDVVLGPVQDGGYILIGLRKPFPCLFEEMPWGMPELYAETRSRIHVQGLSLFELPTRSDVDRPDDLTADVYQSIGWYSENRMTVIIPTRNEAGHIAETVRVAFQDADEVIVADGASEDDTRERAEEAGAKVLLFPYGRGAQLNAAALEAKGEILAFLHADTRLPDGFGKEIAQVLRNPDISACAFELAIEGGSLGVRAVACLANIRSRLLKLPYGDQVLSMRRRDFLEMGGCVNWHIFEDLELVLRLRHRGNLTIIPQKVWTSARRWNRLGVLRTTLINQLMLAAYVAHMDPCRMAALYRGMRERCVGNRE